MFHNNLKFYYRRLINKFSKYPIIYNHGFELNKILSFHKINLITFTFYPRRGKGGKSITILYSYKIPIATYKIPIATNSINV